jgi:hypothetical protein
MRYVRCINNRGFIADQNGELFDETIADLVVGEVYKVVPPSDNDGEFLRVVDDSGEDYLYPTTYFEPFEPQKMTTRRRPAVVHLDEFTRGVLRAEAVAARKSISALLREWVEERLDLPEAAHQKLS